MTLIGPFICSLTNLETLDITSIFDLGSLYDTGITVEIKNHKLKKVNLSNSGFGFEGEVDEKEFNLGLNRYEYKDISRYGKNVSNFNSYLRELVRKPSLEVLALGYGDCLMIGPANPFIKNFNDGLIVANENIRSISFRRDVDKIKFDFNRFTKLKEIYIDCPLIIKDALLFLSSLKNITSFGLSRINAAFNWECLMEESNINYNITKLSIQRSHINIHHLILLISLFPNLECVQFMYGFLNHRLPEYKFDYFKSEYDEKVDVSTIINNFIKKPILFKFDRRSYSSSKKALNMLGINKNINVW